MNSVLLHYVRRMDMRKNKNRPFCQIHLGFGEYWKSEVELIGIRLFFCFVWTETCIVAYLVCFNMIFKNGVLLKRFRYFQKMSELFSWFQKITCYINIHFMFIPNTSFEVKLIDLKWISLLPYFLNNFLYFQKYSFLLWNRKSRNVRMSIMAIRTGST